MFPSSAAAAAPPPTATTSTEEKDDHNDLIKDIVGLTFDSPTTDTSAEDDEKQKDHFGIDTTGCLVKCRSSCLDVDVVYATDQDEDTALHMAIINHDSTDRICEIINATPHQSWLDKTNKLSQTPLHLAILTNNSDVARRLVVAGADVSLRDHNGNTPLHLVCDAHNLSALKAILKPITYQEQKQNNYDLPPGQTSSSVLEEAMQILNYDGLSCVHLAAKFIDFNDADQFSLSKEEKQRRQKQTERFDILEQLFARGADLNIRETKSGRTILHQAADRGDNHLVNFLIITYQNFRGVPHRINVNLNATTFDGSTAFDIARSRKDYDIILPLAQVRLQGDDDDEEELID